jgi:hypothetical protein
MNRHKEIGPKTMNLLRLGNTVGFLIMIVSFNALLCACSNGGSTGGSTGNQSSNPNLSPDQAAFEGLALKGGGGTVSWNIPFGGGNLVNNTNYVFSTNIYNLSASPATAGPQLSSTTRSSMVGALALPAVSYEAYLSGGQILTRSSVALRRVSYVNNEVQIDYLSDIGQQTIYSALLSNYSLNPLSGAMANTPEELLAQYPLQDWVKFGNFAANATWQTGSAYAKFQYNYATDIYEVQNYDGSALSSGSTSYDFAPCMLNSTLDDFFPFTLLSNDNHPTEVDFAGDGTISTVQGVRMWIATNPISPSVSQQYRIYFEHSGNVYGGYLVHSGSQVYYAQTDGSYVNYSVDVLNQQALSSIQAGLITSATGGTANSEQGDTQEVPISTTTDLFGIGGHGINGALTPADLATHYGIPANLDGSGQTIAVIEAPGTGNYLDDLNTFSMYYSLPAVSSCSAGSGSPCLTVNDLSGGATPTSNNDWAGEIALDIQMIHAVAPKANILIVIAASSSETDLFTAINTAATTGGVTAVSMSFGGYQYSCAQDAAFSNAITQNGLIFIASSGDNGNYGTQGVYPASSAFVTAVGGTQIVNVVYSSTASETAWHFTGGGIDTTAPICNATSSGSVMPAWQSNYVGSAIANLNSNQRAVPDVSAVADFQHSAFAFYLKDHWAMGGGTSASTPLWGGIVALYGQYLSNKGTTLQNVIKATPGGFNGLLYQTKLNGTGSFRNVVTGNNNLQTTTCTLCSATVGFDDLTGLGTPNVSVLFSNL